MIISDAGLGIIEKIEQAGFEAYFVGGCVRDVLMGKPPGDIDITTSANPEDIMKIFDKTYPTGIAHGTVTVSENGILAEVTTYRSEKGYKDRRHPDGVDFVSDINEDLCRRDFTINAMAYNPARGLVDNFGGMKDLEMGIIRSVGDPDRRFSEDALRMVRAIRFASVIGFDIEERTLEAIRNNAHLAENISKERIAIEFLKTVHGDFVEKAILFKETGLINYLVTTPETIDFTALGKLKALPEEAPLRFAVIMKNGNAEELLKELRFSNEIIKTTQAMIEGIGIETPLEIKRYINKTGKGIAKLIGHVNGEKYKSELNRIINENQPVCIQDLAVNGTDLADIGITGKKTGQILNMLLQKVWENPQENSKERLLEIAKEELRG